MNLQEAVLQARHKQTVIPAFNIPYLTMVEPVTRAVADADSVAIIQVARVEWEKFSAESLESVAEEYDRHCKSGHTFLGLDHVPVIDEDLRQVDYLPIIQRAIGAGFESVMIDGSRLSLAENIYVTAKVADLVHQHGLACEAELGAVMGHESGHPIPYEKIFASRMGFTKTDEAQRFAFESHCDWLSVAVGNIHGAIAKNARSVKKTEARLDVAHIAALYEAVNLPLVLHGGSGIQIDYIRKGIKAGIAKINIGTEIRQTYEKTLKEYNNIDLAMEAVYTKVQELLAAIEAAGSRPVLENNG